MQSQDKIHQIVNSWYYSELTFSVTETKKTKINKYHHEISVM